MIDADDQLPSASPAIPTALRMLGRRALSVAELQQKLARKGFDSAAVEAAVAAMQRYGYLNDDALAASLAAGAARRGRGPLWVRNTARRRGMTDSLADDAAGAAYLDDQDAISTARGLLARRFTGGLAEPLQRQRAYRFLMNRGFAPDCVRAAVGASTHPWPEETEDTP